MCEKRVLIKCANFANCHKWAKMSNTWHPWVFINKYDYNTDTSRCVCLNSHSTKFQKDQ